MNKWDRHSNTEAPTALVMPVKTDLQALQSGFPIKLGMTALTWFCFDGENMKGLDAIMEQNEAVKEAHKQYERFTADNELMEKYEVRQKYLRDISTIKGVSRDEGFKDGLERGIEKKRTPSPEL